MIFRSGSRTVWLLAVLLPMMLAGAVAPANASRAAAAKPNAYKVTALVADQSGHAANVDANLVNPWGLAASSGSPWWVANNGSSTSTIHMGDGTAAALVVSVPTAPTGVVFNGGAQFLVGSSPALFLFSTEGGTIRAWNATLGTTTALVIDNSAFGAVYKGLAIGSTAGGDRLYAADFHDERIDVFDGNFNFINGGFQDPNLPTGYGPFGIQNIGGTIFVTYALRDASGQDDVPGPGHGIVDAYDTSGSLLLRVATGGALNSPWGLAMAPPSFGPFGGDLLVGNFGDGRINAYKLSGGVYHHAGVLRRPNGNVVKIDGLWGLAFGNGGAAGPTNRLYFTAGPIHETHGLFGSIRAA